MDRFLVVAANVKTMFQENIFSTWSLPQIGRFLGNRDHTTVLNARRKIERLIAAGEVKL